MTIKRMPENISRITLNNFAFAIRIVYCIYCKCIETNHTWFCFVSSPLLCTFILMFCQGKSNSISCLERWLWKFSFYVGSLSKWFVINVHRCKTKFVRKLILCCLILWRLIKCILWRFIMWRKLLTLIKRPFQIHK